MSSKLVGRALEESGLDPVEKLILIGLADCTNTATGLCYPSLKWLGKIPERSKRTVRRWLRSLEESGLIITVERPGTTSLYTVFPTPDTYDRPLPRTPMTGPETRSPDTQMTGDPGYPDDRVTRKNLKREHAREDLDEGGATVAELRQRLRDGHHHWRPGGPDGRCGECNLPVSNHVIEEQEVPA